MWKILCKTIWDNRNNNSLYTWGFYSSKDRWNNFINGWFAAQHVVGSTRKGENILWMFLQREIKEGFIMDEKFILIYPQSLLVHYLYHLEESLKNLRSDQNTNRNKPTNEKKKKLLLWASCTLHHYLTHRTCPLNLLRRPKIRETI